MLVISSRSASIVRETDHCHLSQYPIGQMCQQYQMIPFKDIGNANDQEDVDYLSIDPAYDGQRLSGTYQGCTTQFLPDNAC